MDGGTWLGYCPWGRKESDTTERLQSLTHCIYIYTHTHTPGFQGGSDGKESACNVRNLGSIPRLGRSPGEGHDNSPSILAWRIPMDRGAWRARISGVAKNLTQLSD